MINIQNYKWIKLQFFSYIKRGLVEEIFRLNQIPDLLISLISLIHLLHSSLLSYDIQFTFFVNVTQMTHVVCAEYYQRNFFDVSWIGIDNYIMSLIS